MIERGVVLCAFGKRGYVWSAYNLAVSIKHFSPGIHITLLHDDSFERELLGWQKGVFDHTRPIPFETLYHNGRVDPANIKTSIYEFLPYQYNLFMDVDAKALQDLNIIFDELIADGKYYYAHVIGEHKIEQGREIPSMYWAYADDIWSHYNLTAETVLPSTNSSFQFIKKCDEAEKLFKHVRHNFIENPIPIAKLRHAWGGTQPDELYLNVACAQMGLMPRTPRQYMWMANEGCPSTLTDIQNKYPILCLFGHVNMIKVMYTDWYDRMLINEHRARGQTHFYKWHKIKNDKHANQKVSPIHSSVYKDDILIPGSMPGKVHLIVPFYKDRKQARNDELLDVLTKNVACKNIDIITLIVEAGTTPPSLQSDKIRLEPVGDRQSFANAVSIANQYADDDTVSIVANTDIFFDDRNINLIKACNLKVFALALSRYDLKPGGELKHFNYQWSQDVWSWAGKLDTREMNLDFQFGKPYCDSRMSFELNRVRRVVNPSFSIKTYHQHLVQSRNYSEADRLKGDGIPVICETAHKYMKRRLLFIQPGKVGDIILCLPIARALSKEYIVDWKCPKEYHRLFEYIDYARPVESPSGAYDRTVDIAFGLGGAPEQFWHNNKHKYDSFVTLKYELAGIAIEEKTNLKWNRNIDRENALFETIVHKTEQYALVHSSSTYGTPITVNHPNVVEFKPVGDYTIFDWYKIIVNASEIHCIDSSLCNFIDAIKEAAHIPKFYYKTDKVPAKYDETILTNNWQRV